MEHPSDRKYTTDHEWVLVEDGIGTVGITAHAQDQLGDVVFVELPSPGTSVEKGQQFGTVESTKSVSELYSPVTGEVVEVNESLEEQPDLVNGSPHGDGWMVKIKLADGAQADDLLDAAGYAALLEG